MPTSPAAAAAPPSPIGASEPAVRLRGVRRAFSRGAVALDGLDLEVGRGEVVAVVGPSGCGKSTLLELVCGLQAPDAGEVHAPPAVLLPQRDGLLPWLSALDNAALAPRLRGRSRAAARAAAAPLFAQLGLDGFEQARPAELSGGMRQRVAIVRTLLADKPVLALDEPFAALDALTRAQAHSWLQAALAAAPRTVLLVTHDVEEAVVLADRVAVLAPRPGRVVGEEPVALARPRRPTQPEVAALRARVLRTLEAGA